MPEQPIPAGALPTLANLQLAIQQTQLAVLTDLLKPGAVLTALVGEPLGGNAWQLQLAGRSIVAESPVALPTGSTVQLEVLAGGDVPKLRLIQPSTPVTASSSDPAVQLAKLGLPDEPAVRTALTAFTEVGAPLVPARLAQAAEALRAQPGNTALATAYATVARSGLPAMPLTIDLALRSALPQIPAAIAIAVLETQPTTAKATPAVPALPIPSAAPTGAVTPTVAGPTNVPTTAAPSSSAPPAFSPATPATPSITIPSAVPAAPTLPAATPPASPRATIIVPSAGPTGTVATATAAPSLPASAPIAANVTPGPSPTASTTAPPPANPTSLPSGPTAPAVPVAPLLPLATTAGSIIVPSTPGITLLPLSEAVASPQDMVAVLRRAGLRDASPAVGERSDHQTVHHKAAQNPDDQSALMTRVAQAMVRHADAGGTPGVELRAALVETAAHTVFPPADLADYDLVLPLPLQERGVPVPARLAVSTRTSPGGSTATWLRVDTELSQLGPVSARLAAIDHGPLIVHLVASSAAHEALSGVLPDLEAALAAKGFTTSIRLSVDDG